IQIPYEQMVTTSINTHPEKSTPSYLSITSLTHPNPSYYKVVINKQQTDNATLILSQAFDDGWKAYLLPTNTINTVQQAIYEQLPFLFGKELKNHVLVNNWANGWQLNTTTNAQTIVIVFLPQLLEWIGFLLIPIPFLLMIKTKRYA
ncbi:MAG: hypothetical protein V1917_01400, partial [Candidatus Gottesmanbacteria bacterium]